MQEDIPTAPPAPPVTALLAVDAGLRTGLAEFDRRGRLLRYAAHHAANRTVLRRAASVVLARLPDLEVLALEGGGPLADAWLKLAARRGLRILQVSAETWRREILLAREQRNGRDAKRHADRLAREIIAADGTKRPVSLRHDAAEAILVGLWACVSLGWREGPRAGGR
ncbi:MAG: hypothetical protein JXR77_07515 [Lentisphaeria bacterium]|nr:hypothetical protein [Lentisphaeria bacterium]